MSRKVPLLFGFILLVGCAASGGAGSGERVSDLEGARLLIQQTHFSIELPKRYGWSKQKFGVGETQRVGTPGGIPLTAVRTEATSLSARKDDGTLHSMQVFAMELKLSRASEENQELIEEMAKRSVNFGDMTPVSEKRSQPEFSGARCAQLNARGKAPGSKRFPNTIFEFALVQIDCLHPKQKDIIVRLNVTERAKEGTALEIERLVEELTSGLKF